MSDKLFTSEIQALLSDPLPARDWGYIVIHHSASHDGRTYEWDGIRKYHTSYRYRGEILTPEAAQQFISQGISGVIPPWRDIGYHLGIEQRGYGYVYLKGRPLSEVGAHSGTDVSKKFNEEGIGICLLGNYDFDILKELQIKMLKELVNVLMEQFGIPIEKVIGHREVYSLLGILQLKSCPGNLIDLDQLRNKIKED